MGTGVCLLATQQIFRVYESVLTASINGGNILYLSETFVKFVWKVLSVESLMNLPVLSIKSTLFLTYKDLENTMILRQVI